MHKPDRGTVIPVNGTHIPPHAIVDTHAFVVFPIVNLQKTSCISGL